MSFVEIKKKIDNSPKSVYIIKIDENEYIIKLFEGDSGRYREWIIPEIIIMDLTNWLIQKRKDNVKIINEETDLCKYDLRLNHLNIKRKDRYTTRGYSLPMMVLDHLVEWVQNIA